MRKRKCRKLIKETEVQKKNRAKLGATLKKSFARKWTKSEKLGFQKLWKIWFVKRSFKLDTVIVNFWNRSFRPILIPICTLTSVLKKCYKAFGNLAQQQSLTLNWILSLGIHSLYDLMIPDMVNALMKNKHVTQFTVPWKNLVIWPVILKM